MEIVEATRKTLRKPSGDKPGENPKENLERALRCQSRLV